MTAFKLTQLRLRLVNAIEVKSRACKGSDLAWYKECSKEVENIRGLIGNILRKDNPDE